VLTLALWGCARPATVPPPAPPPPPKVEAKAEEPPPCGEFLRPPPKHARLEAVVVVIGLARNDGESHMCTGALIAPDEVLTARHCVDEHSPDSLLVLIGDATNPWGRLYGADVFTADGKEADDDIAIVRLSHDVPGTTPLRVRLDRPAPTHTKLESFGVGICDGEPIQVSLHGRSGEVFAVDASWMGGALVADMPSCPGDSGSPLLASDEIVGVAVQAWARKITVAARADTHKKLFARASSAPRAHAPRSKEERACGL
jgi:hypothetical protein